MIQGNLLRFSEPWVFSMHNKLEIISNSKNYQGYVCMILNAVSGTQQTLKFWEELLSCGLYGPLFQASQCEGHLFLLAPYNA